MLQYGLFTLAGEYPMEDGLQAVSLPANQSRELAAFSADIWDRLGVSTTVAYAMLTDGRSLVARNRLILPRFVELDWVPATVEVSRGRDSVVFSSRTFAWGVCLDLNGEAVGDNFFDVWPNTPYEVAWPADKALPSILFVGNLPPREARV